MDDFDSLSKSQLSVAEIEGILFNFGEHSGQEFTVLYSFSSLFNHNSVPNVYDGCSVNKLGSKFIIKESGPTKFLLAAQDIENDSEIFICYSTQKDLSKWGIY